MRIVNGFGRSVASLKSVLAGATGVLALLLIWAGPAAAQESRGETTKAPAPPSPYQKALDETLDALLRRIEADLPEEKKTEECHRDLKALELVAGTSSKDFRNRVGAARRIVSIRRLETAVKAADQEAEAAGADLAKAISAYDAPMREFREDLKLYAPPRGPDGRPLLPDQLIEIYKAMIARSDAIVAKLLTEAYIKAVPPIDMLAPSERGRWNGPKSTMAAEWTADGLVLSHIPDAGGRRIMGVFALDGWTTEWWDYEAEIDFEILEGAFDLMLRYRPDGFVYYSTMVKPGENGVEKNRTQRLRTSVVGSTVTYELKGQKPMIDHLRPTVSRTGGIGFALGEGSKVAIKSFKLKLLRPRDPK